MMGEPSYFDGIDKIDELLGRANQQERRPLKIYIAASFPRQDEAKAVGQRLMVEEDHEITSSWFHQEEENQNENNGNPTSTKVSRECAERDLTDINHADVLIMLSGDNLSGGGRRFEMGYAYGKGIPVIVYGPREIVFDHLNIFTVDGFAYLVRALRETQEELTKLWREAYKSRR